MSKTIKKNIAVKLTQNEFIDIEIIMHDLAILTSLSRNK